MRSIRDLSTKQPQRLIGYARVSTHAQELQLQLDELKKVGVVKADVYTDRVSGTKKAHPGLDQRLQALHAGDTLLVWQHSSRHGAADP